jgi:hypothetical protein
LKTITALKNLMKEINEPNEFVLVPFLTDSSYWIFKLENARLKTLSLNLESKRSETARFDIFINGLFISEQDYVVEYRDNDIYIKFIKSRFPSVDRFGQTYVVGEDDEVVIYGDLERING